MKVNTIYQIEELPRIWLSIGAKNWHLLKNENKQPAYLLVHPMWFFSWTSILSYWKHKKALKQKNIYLILLNNSKREHFFSKFFGFHSQYISQNIHVCEHNFVIKPLEKKYDAVYIATAKPYKRIHLAKLIRKLYIITYFWPDIRNEKGEWDLHAFEPSIKHADFNKDRIGATEITTILNSSKCALALSKKEGAMLAVMEYLYSGLPVVSTKSLGGRDLFFNAENSIIVKAHPKAVLDGVNNLIKKELDPHKIRHTTLDIVEKGRIDFYNLCKKLSGATDYPDFISFKENIWGAPDGLEKTRII